MNRPIHVPSDLITLASRQHGLVSRAQCENAGVRRGTRLRLIRRGEWREATTGVFDTWASHPPSDDWQRRARRLALLALLAYPSTAVAIGMAALALNKVEGLPGSFEPEVMLLEGTHRRRHPGVRARRLAETPGRTGWPPKVHRVDGWLSATPVWALAQALPTLTREVAVNILDSALNTATITLAELDVVGEILTGRPGSRLFASWRREVDGRSESPLETRARLECVDAGVPPDSLQTIVKDRRGRIVARCDLTWDLGGGRLLILELDGGTHELGLQPQRDRDRDNALTALGHVVYHFGWRHLRTGVIWQTVRRELAANSVAP